MRTTSQWPRSAASDSAATPPLVVALALAPNSSSSAAMSVSPSCANRHSSGELARTSLMWSALAPASSNSRDTFRWRTKRLGHLQNTHRGPVRVRVSGPTLTLGLKMLRSEPSAWETSSELSETQAACRWRGVSPTTSALGVVL